MATPNGFVAIAAGEPGKCANASFESAVPANNNSPDLSFATLTGFATPVCCATPTGPAIAAAGGADQHREAGDAGGEDSRAARAGAGAAGGGGPQV